MKEHAVGVLGRICGHTKTLKIVSVGVAYEGWEDTRDTKTDTITVP